MLSPAENDALRGIHEPALPNFMLHFFYNLGSDPRPASFDLIRPDFDFIPQVFVPQSTFVVPTFVPAAPVQTPLPDPDFPRQGVASILEPELPSEPMSFLDAIGDFLGDVGGAIVQTSVGAQPDVSSVGGIVGGILGTVLDPFVPDVFRPFVTGVGPGFFPGATTGQVLQGLPVLSPGMTSANVPVGTPIGLSALAEGNGLGDDSLAGCAPPPGWVIETNKRGQVSMHPKHRRRPRRAYPPTVWNQMLLAAKAFQPGDRIIVLAGLARR